jgi:5-methylcytosine-specific restriction endonuclease McrA
VRKSPLRPSLAPIRRRGPVRAVNPNAKARRVGRYVAHLRSAYFRALRAEAFARDAYRCVTCGETFDVAELRAHHVRYTNLPNEPVSDLETYCIRHHNEFHAVRDGYKRQRFT